MADKFLTHADTLFTSARKLMAVTPHDTNELSELPKGLFIGGAGTISVTGIDNTAPVSLTVPAGFILPCRAKIVHATGTTASGIVALI